MDIRNHTLCTFRLGSAVAVLLLLTVAAGCTYPTRGAAFTRLTDRIIDVPGQETAAPRLRLGSMPFNAWYSPLVLLGPDDLGVHRYQDGLLPALAVDETSRGILYGERSGFLDISHVRNAMDLTRFAYEPIEAALRRGDLEVILMSVEPDVFRVELADGSELSEQDRRAVARAVAGRVAYLMTTWHEVATWHGYKGMGLITERPSAFSYDDAASHMVGVAAAQEALKNDPELTDFDQAATQALDRQLIGMGVTETDQAQRYVDSVDGRWYSDNQPQLRVIHMGLSDEPLLARTLGEGEPFVWTFASTEHVAGKSIDAWYDARIDLKLNERNTILAAAGRTGADDDLIHPKRDFPVLRDAMLIAATP